MAYKILKATDPEMLETYVASYRSTGWTLRGDLIVVGNAHGDDPLCWFFQVMTREDR